MTFQKIVLENKIGGTTGTDDWGSLTFPTRCGQALLPAHKHISGLGDVPERVR
jgi:hypothetical protein